MRIALLADLHGNLIATEAVLADIEARGGVDEHWILGDLAAIGYAPAAVVERVAGLPAARPTRGNTDRFVVAGERSPATPTRAAAEHDPRHWPLVVEIERSFAWTQGALTAIGRLDWLAALPLERRLTLPDGTRLLGVHAAPGADDGPGIHAGLDDDELRALLAGCEADLICVGHTHRALDRMVDGIRVVNLGSVSNPPPTERRACYSLLEATSAGYRLEHHRVAYDDRAVLAAIRAARHPRTDYLERFWQPRAEPAAG